MQKTLALLFPEKADTTIRGSKLPLYFLIFTAIIWTVRSCIHVFSADGGAGSIAGMNLAVTGADEVIFAFALWGAEQLIYTLLQWVVIFRYRSLVPLMWGVQLLETLGACSLGISSRLLSRILLRAPSGIMFSWCFQSRCWHWRFGPGGEIMLRLNEVKARSF